MRNTCFKFLAEALSRVENVVNVKAGDKRGFILGVSFCCCFFLLFPSCDVLTKAQSVALSELWGWVGGGGWDDITSTQRGEAINSSSPSGTEMPVIDSHSRPALLFLLSSPSPHAQIGPGSLPPPPQKK